jgi:hypothetical protein
MTKATLGPLSLAGVHQLLKGRLAPPPLRSGNAIVPGLGSVEESYAYVLENAPPGCTAPPGADAVRLPATTVRFTVAGKGEIYLSTGGTGCLTSAGTLRSSESFTITGAQGCTQEPQAVAPWRACPTGRPPSQASTDGPGRSSSPVCSSTSPRQPSRARSSHPPGFVSRISQSRSASEALTALCGTATAPPAAPAES